MTTATQIAPETCTTIEATTDQKALLEGLKFVSAALPTRPPMQVLLGVQLRASASGITLAAFDYELSAREMVAGHGHGLALVPGKLLLDIVKALDPGPVTLRTKGTKVVVGQGDLAFTLPTLPMEDYPALPTTDGKRLATVTGADLVQLNRASVAVGKDNTLPVLTGIRLESRDGKLVAAATDRYRLAVVRSEILAIDVGGAIVPHQVMAFLAKHFPTNTSVTLRVASPDGTCAQMLIAQAGDRIVTARLLEGEFPRYAALIPEQFTGTTTVQVPDLVKAVKQVAVFALRHAPVRFGCSASGLLLEAGNEDDGGSSKLVHSPFDGEAMVTAFNPGYLLDGLNAQGKKQARLRFNGATKPCVIDNTEDPTFLYLLMPVRLSG